MRIDDEDIERVTTEAELTWLEKGGSRASHLAARLGKFLEENGRDAGDQHPAGGEGGGEDPVDHPKHYTSSEAACSNCGHPIECIDVVQSMGFCLGNAIKYIWRCDLKKDAIEDLKKAAWYINREIARRTGNV